jgi:hypothetical protein
MTYCRGHLKQTHDSHGKCTHIFLNRAQETLLAPAWRHAQLWTEFSVVCGCNIERKCNLRSSGKIITFVCQQGQQSLAFSHSNCLSIHEALITIGYVAGTPHKPEFAYHIDMLTAMRELILDCHTNIHSYCEHLSRRSFTNGKTQQDSDIYQSLRLLYPQFSAQMNAMETFSEDPHELKRTFCPACKHSVHRTASITVDGNFSCKCKEHQCGNPAPSFWNNGKPLKQPL